MSFTTHVPRNPNLRKFLSSSKNKARYAVILQPGKYSFHVNCVIRILAHREQIGKVMYACWFQTFSINHENVLETTRLAQQTQILRGKAHGFEGQHAGIHHGIFLEGHSMK